MYFMNVWCLLTQTSVFVFLVIANNIEGFSLNNEEWRQRYPLILLRDNEEASIKDFSWSTDGTKIALLCENGTINLYDTSTGLKLLAALPQEHILFDAFIWNNNNLFTATRCGKIFSKNNQLLSVDQAIQLIRCSSAEILAVRHSAHTTKTLTLYKHPHQIAIPDREQNDFPFCMEWNAEGTILAASGALGVCLYDCTHFPTVTPSHFGLTSQPLRSLVWLSDGRTLIFLDSKGMLGFFDTKLGTMQLAEQPMPQGDVLVTQLALSPDEKLVAVGSINTIIIFSLISKSIVEVIDLSMHSPRLKCAIEPHIDPENPFSGRDVSKLAWSPTIPLLSIALKVHHPLILFPSMLTTLDLHRFWSTHRQRTRQQMGQIPVSKKYCLIQKKHKDQGPS